MPNFNFAGRGAGGNYDMDTGVKAERFLQWVQADPRAKGNKFQTGGGFFLPEDQFPYGFKPKRPLNEIVFDDGTTKQGLGFPVLHFAPMAMRLDWWSQGPERKIFYPDYNTAEAAVGKGNVRGRTRFMGLVLDDDLWVFGPIMLTVNGMSGKSLQNAIRDADAKVRREVERLSREPQPIFRFAIPIVPGPRVQVGDKKFNKFITPPTVALPDGYDLEAIANAWAVSEDVEAVAVQEWERTQEWATAVTGGKWGEPQTEPALADEEEGGSAPAPFRGSSVPNSEPPPWLADEQPDW